MNSPVVPFSLKDAPALIERLLPVQKLSAESYKEQMANVGKTLTALGNYWKGRKPLILAKACVLGCLLPATDNPARDLEIFEKLMAMDDESFVIRWKNHPKPKEILGALTIATIENFFTVEPTGILPVSAPVNWSTPGFERVKVTWRVDINELERRRLEAQMLPKIPYRERVDQAQRPEEVIDAVHDHIWDTVNHHLSTKANSFPELVEQLGVMRFGRRPNVADTFCGSGQIPFEAARLGCDVYASDLNPVACMLTWSAFYIVGGSPDSRDELYQAQKLIIKNVKSEIDVLDIETDGKGWRGRAYLYCVEIKCPSSEWMVPLLPSRIISIDDGAIVDLVADPTNKRYDLYVRTGVTADELAKAKKGTVRNDGSGQDPYIFHTIDGIDYRTKISTLRGDYRRGDGENGNRLRLWEKGDFKPQPDDVFQERLYCIQWMRPKKNGKGYDFEYRSVTPEDLKRENTVEDFVADHLANWQANGWAPDMRIEPGYNTDQPIRERGWTHWHHMFNSRQLLVNALINRYSSAALKPAFANLVQQNARLSRWDSSGRGRAGIKQVFDNQALNTLFNYGARGTEYIIQVIDRNYKRYSLPVETRKRIFAMPANQVADIQDIYITDPPYGDAVRYEEILEFFIAWLRKDPPTEFADWIWDSRRSLAIKGEDENFRRGMVDAYKRMTEYMPDNGIQVLMFTHQDSSIWADMANIVWASGLQVTAAWYVVTETDSALREGSYVKGTVLLVCRKHPGIRKTTRDDLAWEIQEEVESQVQALIGLNQKSKWLYRDENVFEDADIQMAGYAAALRVLTCYTMIDGRDMTSEAIRPRVKGEITFVDGLISFAVDTANQCLVPHGIEQRFWDKLRGAERFYLKMLDMENRGAKRLDNYQNFAKAFKVHDFHALMASQKANNARLKSANEFGRAEMGEGSELHQSVLRSVLYAVMELMKNIDGNEVLAHLSLNIPNYYGDMTQRELAVNLADYLSKHLEVLRPDEASSARVLRELVKNQRLG